MPLGPRSTKEDEKGYEQFVWKGAEGINILLLHHRVRFFSSTANVKQIWLMAHNIFLGVLLVFYVVSLP